MPIRTKHTGHGSTTFISHKLPSGANTIPHVTKTHRTPSGRLTKIITTIGKTKTTTRFFPWGTRTGR